MFAGLREHSLRRVSALAVEKRYPSGTQVFAHGDAGDCMYLIVVGRVRISRDLGGLGEEALAVLGPGQVFGEMALFDDSSRSADALATSDCTLLAISKDDFDDLLFEHKDLAYEVLWATVRLLGKRLREANDKLLLLTGAAKF